MDAAGRIRTFITSNFYVAEGTSLGDDVSFLDSGIIDSTGVLEVVAFIEEQFGIRVNDEEMLPENLDSIGKIVAFIARKTGG